MTCPRHGYPVVKAEHGQVFCDACFAEAKLAPTHTRTERLTEARIAALQAHSVSVLTKRLRWDA